MILLSDVGNVGVEDRGPMFNYISCCYKVVSKAARSGSVQSV